MRIPDQRSGVANLSAASPMAGPYRRPAMTLFAKQPQSKGRQRSQFRVDHSRQRLPSRVIPGFCRTQERWAPEMYDWQL